MIGRLLRLVIFEVQKLVARRLAIVAVVVVALVSVLAPLGGQVLDVASSMSQGKGAGADPFANGWTTLASGLKAGFTFSVFVLLVFGGSAIAEEAQLGTLKSLFVRPIRRRELLLAKWIALTSFAVLLLVVTAATATVVAEARWGFDDLRNPDTPAYVVQTREAMTSYAVRAVLLGIPGLGALVAFALLVSCALDHPGYAVGTAIAGYLLLGIASGLSKGAERVVFTRYVGLSFQLFGDVAYQFGAKEFKQLQLPIALVPTLAGVVFLLAATWLLSRREVAE